MKIAVENLNRVRINKGFTYNDLAQITGYSKNSIQKLLSYNNNSKSRLDIVVKVCKALDVDFPSIFERGVGTYTAQGGLVYTGFDNDVGQEYYLKKFVNKVRIEIDNYTHYYLKTVSGLSESTISDLLNLKTKNPQIETLLKIAKGLEISESEMFR